LSSTYEFKKDKGKLKKSSKPPKDSIKRAVTISTKEPMQISWKSMSKGKKVSYSKETTKKRPTLKEVQEKKYMFLDSNWSRMLDDLKLKSSNYLN